MDGQEGGPTSPDPRGQPSPSTAPTVVPPKEAPDLLDVVRSSLLLYLKNWGVFFFPYLGVGLATILISILLFPEPFSSLPTGIVLARAIAETLALRVTLVSLLIGPTALLALERYRGRGMDLRDALIKGLRRFPTILAATLLLALIIIGVLALPLTLYFLGDVGGGFLLILVAGGIAVALFASLNFYAPVIMLEGLGPLASLRRSWELSRGRRKALFGVYFAFLILAFLVFIIFNIPMDLSNQDIYVTVILGAVRTAILGPWFAIAGALAYGMVVSPASPAVEPRAAGADATA